MLFQEICDYVFSLCESSLEVVVNENIIELAGCKLHFRFCLGNSFLDGFHCVGAASDKSFAQNLNRRGLDEYGESLLAEYPLEVHSSLYVYVEHDCIAFGPDALDL